MPSFVDRKGDEWVVQLDAVIIEEIREDHGINLVNLDNDPMLQLRNDPMTLVSCVSVICREQHKERELTPKEFAKLLPNPPDTMLDAVKEAVIGFFPSGRAFHVREVLGKFDQMAATSERLAESRMVALMEDPRTAAAMNQKADEIVEQAFQSLKTSHAGTAGTTAST